VKRLLLTKLPVPSQVVLCGTLQRGKNIRSIVSKILIQICAKLGGVPWAVDNLPLMDQPTMVCGLDVFHSTALGKKSVLGFCASIDKTATKYWSSNVVHEAVGQEMALQLRGIMEKAVNKFKKVNGVFPARIILYRDGVADVQIPVVCRSEIQQVQEGIAAAGCDAKLVYLNVCKRVNTRIFGGDQGNFKNPMPGTVIDQAIVDSKYYEFYLISVAAK